ncbi:hypothetical protein ACGIF2_11810 [Cellulomonas sp. P22]|uniref:hypothetical protein n=1 Tax=Cellulomonas sp. P22 TaxID=3373189 RepID=UPI0037929C97
MTTLTPPRPLHVSLPPVPARHAAPLTGTRPARAGTRPPFRVVLDAPAAPTDTSGPRPVELHDASEVAVALAAARAEVVRLGFSSRLPTRSAVSALVAQLDEEVAAMGRRRSDVTVLLDVEVVVAADDASARAMSRRLACLDAMAGIAWRADAGRIVAPADQVLVEATRLAREVGADGVVLVPLADSSDLLRALLADAHDPREAAIPA